MTIAGIYYLWKENMSFSEIQHIEDELEQGELDAKSVDMGKAE
jgi:hypothetical protein